jgi:hypothetical protein
MKLTNLQNFAETAAATKPRLNPHAIEPISLMLQIVTVPMSGTSELYFLN